MAERVEYGKYVILCAARPSGAGDHAARGARPGGARRGCLYMYVCVYVYVNTHAYLYLSLSLYIYIYIYMYICIYVYIYIYIYWKDVGLQNPDRGNTLYSMSRYSIACYVV